MSLLKATRYVVSCAHIDIDDLVEQGIRCLLLDRDNTCIPRNTKVAPPDIVCWLNKARSAGLKICFVSNNIHRRRVQASAKQFEADVIYGAMKPFPFALKAALKKESVQAHEAVMIGDQIFTDILAGNLAGMKTILVRPQSQRDLWYTYIMRACEKKLLSGVVFEGEEDR